MSTGTKENHILAEWLHILECDKVHETDITRLVSHDDGDKCYFNLEDQLALTWESPEPDHEKWLARADEVIIGFNSSSAQEALDILTSVVHCMRECNQVINGNHFIREFVRRLI